MIDLSNVSYALTSGHHTSTVLKDASIRLPTDRRLALLGQPHAGKTTLLRLLCGMLDPQAGRITSDCRVSFPVGLASMFRPKLTVLQNIIFAAELYDADPSHVLNVVVKVAGVSAFLKEPLGRVPQQVRTKVAFSLGYALPFDCYLFDNIISAGDDHFRHSCSALLEARSRQAGFILATRDTRIARRYCDMAAVLFRDRILLFDDFQATLAGFDKLKPPGLRAAGPAFDGPFERSL